MPLQDQLNLYGHKYFIPECAKVDRHFKYIVIGLIAFRSYLVCIGPAIHKEIL